MVRASKEWWKRIFDASYRRIYEFTDKTVQRDLAFLEDVLELKPGMTLLDVCCGYGRHSIPLASKGVRVTGLDYSPDQIREARRRAKDAGVEVEWVRGDARAFKSRRRYDRAINMFTAFGYFETEAEDALMMERMADALRPGGVLCLDTMHRDSVTRHFQPSVGFAIGDGHVLDTNTLDFTTGRIDVHRVIYRNGSKSEYDFSLRLYTARELILMARGCGLDVTETYGNLDKKPLSADAPRVILIARKP